MLVPVLRSIHSFSCLCSDEPLMRLFTEGFSCFYLEPVDGTAVDERRKHSHSASESIANRTHSQHHMKVCTNSLDKEVVHRQRGGVDFTALQEKKASYEFKTFVNEAILTFKRLFAVL